MDYAYYYNNARSRYYNASSEITSCQNMQNELNHQKQNTINRINCLSTELSEYEKTLNQVSQIIKRESDVNSKITYITNKTTDASDNYTRMIISSDVPSKNLSTLFGDETEKVMCSMEDSFSTLNAKKELLSTKIADIKSQLTSKRHELDDIKCRIRTTASNEAAWKDEKRNASYDMEYYRRRMQETI